jgi:nucleoside-triphosphatase THEP1
MIDEGGLLDIKQAELEESVQEVIKRDSMQEVIKRKRCGMLDALDGLDLDDPDSYLHREPLVEKAIAVAQKSSLLIVSSPPGTGKTSLIQLIIQKLENTSGDNCVGFILRPSQPNKQGFDLFDFVETRTGVSYDRKNLAPKLQTFVPSLASF